MKFLLIQSKGRHPENSMYREALCLNTGLNLINGITSYVWGFGYQNSSIPLQKILPMVDVVVHLENYYRPKENWLPNLSKIKQLKVFWSIDAHLSLKRHLQIVDQHKINIVLNSTHRFVSAFNKKDVKSFWFPNCYSDDLIHPIDNVKKLYNIGFCGRYVNRKRWIDLLYKQFKIKRDIMVLGFNMVKAINSYKIHFNRNYSNDVNYRTFETMGCRTLLLTNNTDRLCDLVAIGKHCIVYKDYKDCAQKIKFLITNPEARIEIENSGHQHVLKNHTYKVRAQQLVKLIKECA